MYRNGNDHPPVGWTHTAGYNAHVNPGAIWPMEWLQGHGEKDHYAGVGATLPREESEYICVI